MVKWLDYWLKTYKKPLDFEKEQLRNTTKGGRVSASSYSRMNQTYKSQIKETREEKLLLRKQLEALQLAIGCRSGELRALDWEHVIKDII